MRMLVTASRSFSSTQLNTISKDDAPPALRETSFDENDESQHGPPEPMNSRLDVFPSGSLGPAASSETTEVLRVTVLYLEGIQSPTFPSVSISVWVGFRSSFPSGSMTISSSGYSSYFLKEGNLLAVESDQVKWTPTHDNIASAGADGSTIFASSGIAFWNSLHPSNDEISDTKKKAAPDFHLDITIPSPRTTSLMMNDELPDILEFHVCLVCEKALPSSGSDDSITKKSTWKRINSSTSLTKWDNIMEEEHWYKDDSDEDHSSYDQADDMPHLSPEQELQHGVAHLKVPRDTNQICALDSGGKIFQLPIRTTRQQSQPARDSHDCSIALLDHAASISIKVERVRRRTSTVGKESSGQRHYVESSWNGMPYTAPPSVKCGEDDSNEIADPKITPRAKHFHFNTIKSIMPSNAENISGTNDPAMCKIQQALESSFKLMTDRRELAAALRQQREIQHASPERVNFPPTERSRCAVSQGLSPSFDHYLNLPNTSANLDNNIVSSSSLLEDNEEWKKQNVHINQPDQRSIPLKKSIMQRLFCGASMNLTDVIHHCDEEQVGIYVVDSQSSSS